MAGEGYVVVDGAVTMGAALPRLKGAGGAIVTTAA